MPREAFKKINIKSHLQAEGIKVESVEQLLAGIDEEKKRTIMKIIRAMVR